MWSRLRRGSDRLLWREPFFVSIYSVCCIIVVGTAKLGFVAAESGLVDMRYIGSYA